MNDNVRKLSNGLTPDEALEVARNSNPRVVLISMIDENGVHITFHSDMNAAMLSFLTLSTHAQVSKFLSGG